MLKKTIYFEATSIHNDKEYHDKRNLLISNYSYSYIPTSVLLQIVKAGVENHNKDKTAGNNIHFIFIASLDKEHAQFALTGKRKNIDTFVTDFLTSEELLNHWTVSKISKYSLVH